MSTSSKNIRRTFGLAVAVVALATTTSAFALQALPAGLQVNDDPGAGIDKAISVSGQDPTNADVVGGALAAGKAAVPWAVFRQQETNGSSPPADQIFARSFANGSWLTRGSGTVGGHSSAGPMFSGSLNFDQGQDGEAPAIDFAGSGRTVPWATWYENTTGTGFANNNVFASRFDNSGDASQGKWIFGGQSRGAGGGSVPVPSLNIHTDQSAENPSVAGGSAVDPTRPGPWVTWQETTAQPVERTDEIFVSRPIGPGAANCDGVTPAGVTVEGHVPAIGGFCFQQTGVGRVGPGGHDPSLNVDPTRNGVEPDIAFTGVQDSVPWIVWYEKGKSALPLNENEMVFAARGIKDEGAEGGFHWETVGNHRSAVLDTAGSSEFGVCSASTTNEQECSLNKSPGMNDAENPRVAAGTMNPANPTAPWVAWDEDVAGVHQVFVSRFVATPSPHFEIVNNGEPISTGKNDSTRPDIAFSGNTPYVSWREETGTGATTAVNGHFVNAAKPTFVLDGSNVSLTPTAQADVREPISSSCIATPFNSDGAACQGGAVGTPFFLFTNGTSPRSLFANAYAPDTPVTAAASGVSASAATLNGTVNPEGASVKVSFQFGATTAYGQATAAQSTGPTNAATPFAAHIAGLPAAGTIHYRAMAVSDFGTFVGADETLTTASTPPAPGPGTLVGHANVSAAKVSGSNASVRVSCTGAAGATCRLVLKLSVTETVKGHKLVAVTARATKRKTHRVVGVGSATLTLKASQTQTARIALNRTGRRLLASRHRLKAKLRVTEATASGGSATVSTQTVSFKSTKRARTNRGR